MDIKILNKISKPEDIKGLSDTELIELAAEVREVLIDTVSKNGGHLASNLGVVELTIAMHKVFDSPKDQFVWDVGHQVYTHKLLTGRYDKFSTLRTEGGISGFPRPAESEHDMFQTGHSSTSVSSAYGLAVAKALNHDDNSYSVAVIGDGSFTGGLAYEALNNAGRSKKKLIVILNDNEMSISPNVGSMARYLAAIRTKPKYYNFMVDLERVLCKLPPIVTKAYNLADDIRVALKNYLYSSTIFENMGFKYMGPIDGHDITKLCNALEGAKLLNRPVLLHINTVKGKGYEHAERLPSQFHGISKFDVISGEPVFSGANFSEEFGKYICEFAQDDKRICAITAAMSLGTGLEDFSCRFKDRFFDIGIAEEHAIPFACGLAKNGMLPVFAVYSTFLQRCYDQLIHDAALQNQKIVFAIDRAGIVGEDGETHQGVFDAAFLNTIPNVTVYSPTTFDELKSNLEYALYKDSGVVAVRYPRGREIKIPDDYIQSSQPFMVYGEEDAKNVIVTYGRIFSYACEAIKILDTMGIKTKVLKLNKIKPIDEKVVDILKDAESVFFFEEGIKSGGIGEKLALMLIENNFKGNYKLRAINDCFVEHASVQSLLRKYGLNTDAMVELVSGSAKLD